MNGNELAQMLYGNQNLYLGQYLGVGQDSRPMRVRLNERLQRNNDEIARLAAANDGIRALLADLDEHPVIERITDTVKRILG